MTACLVVGHAIATAAHPSLEGARLVLCQKTNEDGTSDGSPPTVAVDTLGAGMHQRVLVTTDGEAARDLLGDERSPVRNSVLALLDDEEEEGRAA